MESPRRSDVKKSLAPRQSIVSKRHRQTTTEINRALLKRENVVARTAYIAWTDMTALMYVVYMDGGVKIEHRISPVRGYVDMSHETGSDELVDTQEAFDKMRRFGKVAAFYGFPEGGKEYSIVIAKRPNRGDVEIHGIYPIHHGHDGEFKETTEVGPDAIKFSIAAIDKYTESCSQEQLHACLHGKIDLDEVTAEEVAEVRKKFSPDGDVEAEFLEMHSPSRRTFRNPNWNTYDSEENLYPIEE